MTNCFDCLLCEQHVQLAYGEVVLTYMDNADSLLRSKVIELAASTEVRYRSSIIMCVSVCL